VSSGAARCDQILALIDACIAEAGTPPPGRTGLIGPAVAPAPVRHIDEVGKRPAPHAHDARRGANARHYGHNRQVLPGTTIVAATDLGGSPNAA
jgi:hypothetical protein